MLDEPLCELYSAPPETFPCRAVVQNSDGGVSIVPSTNGRPLAVLTVVDSRHGGSPTHGAPPADVPRQSDPRLDAAGRGDTNGGTGRAPAQPKPGCCTLQ